MNRILFDAITEWQAKTFKGSTAKSNAIHLQEETEELVKAIETNAPDKREEYADCFILLIGAAKADGMDYDSLTDAIKDKFEKIKTRKWDEPDSNGVVRHVKENQQTATKQPHPDVRSKLCHYDSRNPDGYASYADIVGIEEDYELKPEARKDCACDNCFYGRAKLAEIIIELQNQSR